MNADSLLYWMTDRAAGSWQQFKDAVAVLGGDQPGLTSYLLGSLNYADFSFTTRARWKISAPTLIATAGTEREAVLVGARTPRMLEELQRASEPYQVKATLEAAGDAPQRLILHGERSACDRLCAELKVGFIHDAPAHFANVVYPMWALIEDRQSESRPMNWTPRYFDFASLSWLDGVKTGAACEFTSSYQVKRYFFHVARNRFIPMHRHECVYAAAAASGIPLASYGATERVLRVPTKAALPVNYARWATLISLNQPISEYGFIRYTIADATAARTLLAYLGQPYCPRS